MFGKGSVCAAKHVSSLKPQVGEHNVLLDQKRVSCLMSLLFSVSFVSESSIVSTSTIGCILLTRQLEAKCYLENSIFWNTAANPSSVTFHFPFFLRLDLTTEMPKTTSTSLGLGPQALSTSAQPVILWTLAAGFSKWMFLLFPMAVYIMVRTLNA